MGGMGCHVLLDGDLGHVLDGVVDIVADGLDNRGSSNNWGVVDNRDNSLANGVDEAVLVEILRKTLEGERSVALGCCD